MEQIQNFAPVIIPTLNRYEHFKRCIESLSRCTWAEETEVYVGLDYPPSEKYREGYEKIKQYLENCGNLGFKELHIIKRESNYGASANWGDLKQMAYLKSDTYIGSEDDNEFSPCFLDFMNKALENYWDDERVMTVCGYIPISWEVFNQGVVYDHDSTAWGVGYWKHKKYQDDMSYYHQIWNKKYWKLFFTTPSVAMMFLRMVKSNQRWGDVMHTCANIIEDKYQVRPSNTFVRQCGQDGSGLHCGNDNCLEIERQISDDKVFVWPDSQHIYKLPNGLYFRYLLPDNLFERIYVVLKYFLKGILVRSRIITLQ